VTDWHLINPNMGNFAADPETNGCCRLSAPKSVVCHYNLFINRKLPVCPRSSRPACCPRVKSQEWYLYRKFDRFVFYGNTPVFYIYQNV